MIRRRVNLSDETTADGEGGRFDSVRDVEFGEDVRYVRRHGFWTDEERIANLAVGVALDEQPQHIDFASREAALTRGAGVRVRRNEST